jgi:large subunit ribosomal protein L33
MQETSIPPAPHIRHRLFGVLVNRVDCCYNTGQFAFQNFQEIVVMAAKKGNRIVIKLRSTESAHTYTTLKNRKNDPNRLELRRYDPTLRRHVTYRESK